jgi:hypothetical protein
LKTHERLFHERVPLPAAARAQIHLTDPFDFAALAEERRGLGLPSDAARA